MKIGLYGGTFDPIHHGHLILARTAREELELDRVIFIPAALSPHKLATVPAPAALRWEMIVASIAGELGFVADDLELKRPGPSYTYDTVMHYRAHFPEAELFYFIGFDNLAKLDTWHRSEDLKNNVTLVVMDRGERGEHGHRQLSRRVDVSASEIRNRIANGQSVRYLVTPAVDVLIQRHGLYQNASH